MILLTGATGFIGGRLVARLVADAHRVRCLVRPSSDIGGLQPLAAADGPGVELVVGDLTERGSLAQAVAGCEYVVHCGAMVSDWGTVAEIRAANATASAELGTVAVRAGVRRFVHLSTTDVYGNPGAHAVEEGYRADGFANWYAQTKREAEAALERIGHETGMELVILRPATVYGPGSMNVVAELAKALRGGYLPLIGGGRAIAGLVYIDNLVDALAMALAAPEAVGEAFNVTDGVDVTWRQFSTDLARATDCRPPRVSLPTPLALGLGIGLEEGYRILRRWTGLSAAPLLSRQAVQVLTRDQDFSSAKLTAVLGWSPRVSYEDGLARTVAWLHGEHPSPRGQPKT